MCQSWHRRVRRLVVIPHEKALVQRYSDRPFVLLGAPAKILALLLCCSLWSGCSTPTQSRDTLRVLSWNIHHGQGIDGALDLPRVAGIISSWEPDVVCLQEVDRRTIRAGGVDQAVELGYLLGMESAFHRCIDHQGGEYGDAILTKFKPREIRELKLPGKLEQRGLIGVVISPGRIGLPS